MNAYSKTTSSRIVGTVEQLRGTANIVPNTFSRTPNGDLHFDYEGYTEVDWGSQRTATLDGDRRFIDADGREVAESDIELREDRT